MKVVIGLDVSTSIIGWSIVHKNSKKTDLPIDMGHFNLTKIKDFWAKVDATEQFLFKLFEDLKRNNYEIETLVVEDALKKFQRGKSTAHTISILSKFNVIVSYFARSMIKLDPIYIDCTDARKELGIPLLSKKKAGGKNQKIQTFEYLQKNMFKDHTFPLTRFGNIKQHCYDEVDAFVIASTGSRK